MAGGGRVEQRQSYHNAEIISYLGTGHKPDGGVQGSIMRKPVFFIALNGALLTVVFFFLMQSLLIIQMLGTVDHLQGTAQVRRRGRGEWRTLVLKDVVHASDQVRTSSEGTADLRWRDGTRIRLAPGTTLTIEKFAQNSANKAQISLFDLSLGRVWVRLVQALKPASRFEIETPTAVASVRGTVFSVGVADDGNTSVSVFEGAVAVRDRQSQTLSVGAGRRAEITKASAQAREADPLDHREWSQQERIVGPALVIESPAPETRAVSTPTLRIEGYLEPGASLTINGQPASLRRLAMGEFRQTVALQPGRNLISIVATDKHGRQTSVTREILRTEPGLIR